MFQGVGILQYGPGIKAAIQIDEGIVDFYRSLIPRWIRYNRQKYPAHISVVRFFEKPNMANWGVFEGEEVQFEYLPEICDDQKYFWLNVQCPRIGEIREALGLTKFVPWRNGYHITLANKKELHQISPKEDDDE